MTGFLTNEHEHENTMNTMENKREGKGIKGAAARDGLAAFREATAAVLASVFAGSQRGGLAAMLEQARRATDGQGERKGGAQ